jgi:hypothetical protein
MGFIYRGIDELEYAQDIVLGTGCSQWKKESLILLIRTLALTRSLLFEALLLEETGQFLCQIKGTSCVHLATNDRTSFQY